MVSAMGWIEAKSLVSHTYCGTNGTLDLAIVLHLASDITDPWYGDNQEMSVTLIHLELFACAALV